MHSIPHAPHCRPLALSIHTHAPHSRFLLLQAARKIHIAKFRAGRVRLLLVTDVAARGLDIPLLDNVVNYGGRGPHCLHFRTRFLNACCLHLVSCVAGLF